MIYKTPVHIDGKLQGIAIKTIHRNMFDELKKEKDYINKQL